MNLHYFYLILLLVIVNIFLSLFSIKKESYKDKVSKESGKKGGEAKDRGSDPDRN